MTHILTTSHGAFCRIPARVVTARSDRAVTISASVPSGAKTCVIIYSIDTQTRVQTWCLCTIVLIYFTVLTIEPGLADACIATGGIYTSPCPILVTPFLQTLIEIRFTSWASIAIWARASIPVYPASAHTTIVTGTLMAEVVPPFTVTAFKTSFTFTKISITDVNARSRIQAWVRSTFVNRSVTVRPGETTSTVTCIAIDQISASTPVKTWM